ncbi:hypothetical protein ACSZNJ_03715 [Aeromonas hydrophila]
MVSIEYNHEMTRITLKPCWWFSGRAGCQKRLTLCDFSHALVRLVLFCAAKPLTALDYFAATDMINRLLSNRASFFLCLILLSGKRASGWKTGFSLT